MRRASILEPIVDEEDVSHAKNMAEWESVQDVDGCSGALMVWGRVVHWSHSDVSSTEFLKTGFYDSMCHTVVF